MAPTFYLLVECLHGSLGGGELRLLMDLTSEQHREISRLAMSNREIDEKEQKYVIAKYKCFSEDCRNKRYHKDTEGYCLSCYYMLAAKKE